MQVSVSQSGKLGRKMKVEVPASDIAVSEDKRLKKLSKSENGWLSQGSRNANH